MLCLVLDPDADLGLRRLVQTDMGNAGAREMGMAQAPVTLERSVQGLVAAVRYMSFSALAIR